MILRLTCKEGFSYIGWQRVVAEFVKPMGTYEIKENVSKPLAQLHNALSFVADNGTIDESRLRYDEESMFVLSGESFSLADFANVFESLLGDEFEVTYIDGDEDGE